MSAAGRLLLVLLPVWAVCCAGLWRVWVSHPQYAYGWSVPLLSLFFIWRRSETLPDARPPEGRAARAALLLAGAALLPVPLLRVISEANLDWRPVYAALMVCAIAVSGALVFRAGGLPWLRRLAFPLFFPLCALPWPSAFERDLTNALSAFNAAAALETMALAGVYAVRQGNVIHTVNGSVGVEEACSGIRSLQTCFMLALCFGELLNTRRGGRIGLFALAPVIAALLNLLRTLTLVMIVSFAGPRRMEEAHDTVAVVFMLLQVAATWGVALLFPRAPESGAPPAERKPAAGAWVMPAGVCAAGLALAVFGEAAPHVWFRMREPLLPAGERWELVKPDGGGWEEIKLPRLALEILGSDSEVALTQSEARGVKWLFYGFRWAPGNLMAIPAKSHSPEVCMTGRAGMRLVANAGRGLLDANGLKLGFDYYQFEAPDGALWRVLFGGFEDRGEAGLDAVEVRVPDARRRLRWAWEGRRNRGFTSLEFVATGPLSEEEFFAGAVARLRELVRPVAK